MRLEGLVEQRTNGFAGSESDNQGLRAVQALADVLGLSRPEAPIRQFGPWTVDTRFYLWLAYLSHPLRILAAFATPGNVSDPEWPAITLFAAHCDALAIEYRSIAIDPTSGSPRTPEDLRWLVQLPRRVRAT
jgi:hypothetical protein